MLSAASTVPTESVVISNDWRIALPSSTRGGGGTLDSRRFETWVSARPQVRPRELPRPLTMQRCGAAWFLLGLGVPKTLAKRERCSVATVKRLGALLQFRLARARSPLH